MSLSKIKEELYQKETPTDLARPAVSEYDPHSELADASKMKPEGGDFWQEKQTGLDKAEKTALRRGLVAAGIVLGVIVLLTLGYLGKQTLFNSSAVALSITGPTQADSGKAVAFEIDYKNNNWTSLGNATLEISYPEALTPGNNPNFISDSPTSGYFALGTLGARSGGKVIFNAEPYSPRGALVYLKARLKFNSFLASAPIETDNQLGLTVAASPIDLEFQGPLTVSSGNAVDYQITYRNDSTRPEENLRIKVDYPSGFTFFTSNPAVSESDNTWYIGELLPGAAGKIVVSGKIDGQSGQNQTAKAYVGSDQGGTFAVASEQDVSTQIVNSPLSISQTVNGLTNLTANAGDTLQFDINYKNTGHLGLGNVIVTEKLASPVLDYTTLNLPNGNYDQDTQTITWKASDIPNLANLGPGQGGDIRFSVKVKNIIPVSGGNDKNFVITSLAQIDSPDIPTPLSGNKTISGNEMDIKVNSKLLLDVQGYHNEPNPAIVNVGPVPPQVGQTTDYTIHWRLTNVSNDISNAQVAATLPTGVTYTGKIYPTNARLDFNSRTNALVWKVGNVPAGTGILTPPEEVIFQVSIMPAPNQIGQQLDLVSAATLAARDDFTNQNLQAEGDAKTTELPEDPAAMNGSRVVN